MNAFIEGMIVGSVVTMCVISGGYIGWNAISPTPRVIDDKIVKVVSIEQKIDTPEMSGSISVTAELMTSTAKFEKFTKQYGDNFDKLIKVKLADSIQSGIKQSASMFDIEHVIRTKVTAKMSEYYSEFCRLNCCTVLVNLKEKTN